MKGQISLLNGTRPNEQEIQFIQSIMPSLEAALGDQGFPASLLSVKSTKNSSGYTAVFLKNFTVFRIHLRGKKHYFSIPSLLKDLVPESFPTEKGSESNYFRLLVNELHPFEQYSDLFAKLTVETLNRYPKDWDCCSRYVQCSDAKKCIHPDKEFALSCGYRKILNSGRIFYGENRNID